MLQQMVVEEGLLLLLSLDFWEEKNTLGPPTVQCSTFIHLPLSSVCTFEDAMC